MKILRSWQVAVTHTLSTALKVCPLHKSPTNETRSRHKFSHWSKGKGVNYNQIINLFSMFKRLKHRLGGDLLNIETRLLHLLIIYWYAIIITLAIATENRWEKVTILSKIQCFPVVALSFQNIPLFPLFYFTSTSSENKYHFLKCLLIVAF